MEDGHAKTVEQVLQAFGTDPERGLTLDQVRDNQKKYGPNGKFSSYLLYTQKARILHKSLHVGEVFTGKSPRW